MPVIQVTATAAKDDATDAARLASLCAAVAAALGLPPSGVVAALCASAVTCTGSGAIDGWPLAVIHGSDRGEEATRNALAAAAAALAEGWGTAPGDVWVEWATAGGAVSR